MMHHPAASGLTDDDRRQLQLRVQRPGVLSIARLTRYPTSHTMAPTSVSLPPAIQRPETAMSMTVRPVSTLQNT